MKNRPTIFLSAVLSGLIACAAMAVIPLSAEGAPGECLLAKPKTAAPPGQFWLHLNEWGSNRRCWVLRAKLEAPSQAKGSIPVQAARIGARTIDAPPTRSTDDAAADLPSTQAELPAQPRIEDDEKGAARTGAAPEVAEHAEQSLLNVERTESARLPPLASRAPEPASARPSAGASPATPVFVAQTRETNQHASAEASRLSVAQVTEATAARPIRAPSFVQIFFLAIFFGPALYLLAAGVIRRLTPAEERQSPVYASLDDAPGHRMLLPPQLEPRGDAVRS